MIAIVLRDGGGRKDMISSRAKIVGCGKMFGMFRKDS